MSIRIFPMAAFGAFELLIIVGIVFLVVSLTRKRRPEADRGAGGHGPRRHPRPPAPPGRMRSRPTVSGAQLAFALIFLPLSLVFWALGSLGDLVAIPIHALVGTVTGFVALLLSLVGAYPPRLWRVSGRQFARAGRAAWNCFARLLSTFGLGGLIDRVREDAEDPDLPEWARPAANGAGSGIAPRTYPFEDRYRIESNLGSGGSTARLFVVRRVEHHRPVGDRLVLKYFDMGLGSRLEEVIRESRGMQVAKDMGVVLDHHLAQDHFYYVMPYYEGETLTRAAARIHRHLSASEEMEPADVATCLSWIAELLRILDGYHRHGVIHKDVKPDNVIVTDSGIRLVDLGLLTPLTSAMTLTTHGTEYFRDPEMVKLAVQGKRVRDVHAVRFDVYSTGAVLYYLLEGSFPACGPLSRFSRPVPMALSVIVSRAMAEGEKRYRDIGAMRADLGVAARALEDGWLEEMPVSRLPSMSGEAPAARAPAPPPQLAPAPASVGPARRPRRGGLRALGIALLALVLLAAFLFWATAPRSATGRHDAPTVDGHDEIYLTGEVIAQRIETWRHTIQLLHEENVGGTSLSSVPVLLVPDESLAADRIVGDAEEALSIRGIPFHPSRTLEEKVRTILDEAEGNMPVIDERIAAASAPDEPPMVVHVADLGYRSGSGRREVELRFRYAGISRSARYELLRPGEDLR